ncbi:hypothetical protein L9F63_012120, partial [Diploptera punctata]
MRTLQVSTLLRTYFRPVSPSLCRLKSTAVEVDSRKLTTRDEETVTFYGTLANTWWDEQGQIKPLHSLNKLRVQFVRDGLINTGQIDPKHYDSPHPLQGLKILDVGCGGGIFCEPLARLGAVVTGIDANQDMIELAKCHASQDPTLSDRLTYVCQTVEEHVTERKDYYDAIVASEVLEHVSQKELFLSSSVTSMKPGGSFFITTLNRTFALWLFGIVFAEYILRAVPRGTHNVNECAMPHEVQALLEK